MDDRHCGHPATEKIGKLKAEARCFFGLFWNRLR
jgi:hypothetical protein